MNALIAVWTHEALFSYDWLTSSADPYDPLFHGVYTDRRLREEDSASSLHNGRDPRATHGVINTDGSVTSRLDPAASKNGSALASRYVAAGSRLHHMLNAFAGPSELDSQGLSGRSQQTTAFLIEDSHNFERKFKACVREIEDLQPLMPSAPPSVDGKMLLCVVLDLGLQTNESSARGDDSELISPHEEPNHATFSSVIAKSAATLEALNFNLIWVVSRCRSPPP